MKTFYSTKIGDETGAGSLVEDLFIPRDLFSEGGLWLWGLNNSGQLGDGTSGTGTDKSSPVQTVTGGTNWKLVSCGNSHTTAIKTDGTLWTWGNNSYGELGTNDRTNRSSPVQTISTGTNWKLVATGTNTTAAIKTDGTLWMFGRNNNGQLGTNDISDRSSPAQTVSGGTNWKLVSCGKYHTTAIKTDGTLWSWGRNNAGQLGTNNTISVSSPVQTISTGTNWKVVSCGWYHIAAIKADGTLWSYGSNFWGQLGTNDTLNRSSPVQTVSGGNNWKLVSCGIYHTAAIKTDGSLWLWGINAENDGKTTIHYGSLGTNDTLNRSSPVQTVSGGNNWKLVSCGGYTTSAIKTDGTLWLWGRNSTGSLGDGTSGTTSSKSSPVQTIAGGSNWKLTSCGDITTAALREDYW